MKPDEDPPAAGDGPTPERLAMADGQTEPFISDSGRRTVRMLDRSVLDMLNNRGSISGDQYVAGSQFYEDWYTAGLAASGVIDPAREVVDGGLLQTQTDHQLDALFAWKRAMQAVGIIHSHSLVSLVLLEESLLSYGRRVFNRTQEKQATVAAITALQLALSALDLHYHGQRRLGTRASHSDGYRPNIPPIDNTGSRDVHDSAIPTITPADTRPPRRV